MTQHQFAKRISSLDAVEKTFHVTGSTDMMIIVRLKDTKALEAFIERLKNNYTAIDRTQTITILSET